MWWSSASVFRLLVLAPRWGHFGCTFRGHRRDFAFDAGLALICYYHFSPSSVFFCGPFHCVIHNVRCLTIRWCGAWIFLISFLSLRQIQSVTIANSMLMTLQNRDWFDICWCIQYFIFLYVRMIFINYCFYRFNKLYYVVNIFSKFLEIRRFSLKNFVYTFRWIPDEVNSANKVVIIEEITCI